MQLYTTILAYNSRPICT